jgi:hypothetical protein
MLRWGFGGGICLWCEWDGFLYGHNEIGRRGVS